MNGRQFGTPEPRPMAERPVPRTRMAAPIPASNSAQSVDEPENVSLKTALNEAKKPKGTRRESHRKGLNGGVKRIAIIASVVIVILVVLSGMWLLMGKLFSGSGLTGINKSGYQAVYLTNGQAYFGKLQSGGTDYLKLSDIYYLQSQSTDTASATTNSKDTDTNTTSQSNLQLYKMTDATLVGPEDTMYISTKQILLYENLKPDSKVVQSIEKYQQAHTN